MQIQLTPFVVGQQIHVYGRRVGYVTETGAINFLTAKACRLTADEKRKVISYIVHECNIASRPTMQNREFWPDDITDPSCG